MDGVLIFPLSFCGGAINNFIGNIVLNGRWEALSI